MLQFLHRHWVKFLGCAIILPDLWRLAKWVIDTLGRIDVVASLGSRLSPMLTEPPHPLLSLGFLILGGGLIWWDLKGRPAVWRSMLSAIDPENSTRNANPSEVANPKEVAVDLLPASEVDRRVKILDAAYAILRDQFEPAIDDASRLRNTWPNVLQSGGPQTLRLELKNALLRYSEVAQQLGKLSQEYEYYADIQQLLNQSYQKDLQEAVAEARTAAEALPDPLAGNWKFFYQPYANRYYEGVVKWAQWTHATKDKIISSRNNYLTRVAR